jgi:ribonuclease VapC
VIIDTSALLAILFDEPESALLIYAIAAARTRMLPAPVLVEASAVVLTRIGPAGDFALDALLRRLDISVVPMSDEAATIARSAYARFGKGVGAPPVLNFGDCLSYGVAVSLGEPLLYKGKDFAQTDIDSAL